MVQTISLEPSRGQIQGEFLDKLALCESGNQDITILDVNDKYSIGWFMFQQSTFDYYGNLYNLPHDDIHSYAQQRAIASKMISQGLWKNWYTCSKEIGIPQ